MTAPDATPEALFDDAPGNDYREAWRIASGSADRFRDVICQALGLDENPGDDDLVFLLLKAHGKADEPESHRWRGFLDDALAAVAVAWVEAIDRRADVLTAGGEQE